MDWTVRPLHATNLQERNFQIQGLYQSQQPTSGFSQASASTQNSSAYIGNDQARKIHPSTGNMVPNQLSPQNNVGSNNFQPPLLKSSVPVIGIGTTPHFVGQHPHIQLSSMTVQMASAMAPNTQPNSNVHIFSPVAPQPSTANPMQRPPIRNIASKMYNNRPQKNCSHSVQGSGFSGNGNSSHSKNLPLIFHQYQPANPQTHVTVPLNQVSSHFLQSQNSSCLTFPSGQSIQNQINDINSGSATAMQSQQNASNSVYSSPYTIPTYYAAQVFPQATNTNLPPPPNAVPPIQINRGQFVLPQPAPNTSNQNIQNLELDQSSASYSVQHVQTPESVPYSRETNQVGGAADNIRGHSTENQPSDELTKSAVEALNNICNSLQISGSVPLDKMSTLQTTRSIIEDNTAKSPENAQKSMKESLEVDRQNILAMKKKLSKLQDDFKLKFLLYRSAAQKSKTSDSSAHSLPTSNTSKQLAPLPQATHQTFSLTSHNATQNLISLTPHDNTQQIQDISLLPLKKKNYLYPILKDLLKGTIDEEILLNTHVANTERNQSKQFQEKCSTGTVLESSGKSETSVNDRERTSRLSPETSQSISTQGSLTSTNVNLGFEQTVALGQLTNVSAMSGGDLFNGFVLNKNKVGTTVTKILTNPQSTVSVQNPDESLRLGEKLAKEGSKNSQNPSSVQQSKNNFLQIPDKSITAWNNGNDTSSSASLTATVSEAGKVQRSSFTWNSVGRTYSLEELRTSLSLWKKSPIPSLNDKLGANTNSTVYSSSLDGVEDKERECTMKYLPSALTHYENSSITVGKNEPTQPSVTSALGQKLDIASSNSSKNSEPQVAIVPPLILSKDGIQNEVQEKNSSSMLEKVYPVITEGSVHNLHKFVLTSDTDKLVKRTACSPDSCVTVKEVDSNMHQKTTKSTEENGIQRAESETACSCDPNQMLTGPLELEKNIPQLYSRDSFPLEINKESSSPVSQKYAPKTSPDLVESQSTRLDENMLQISSVCTLVQGDAFYNSHIANIFNPSPKVEDNTSSEDQRHVSYHKEQQLSHWKRESEMNERTSMGDGLLPSLDTLSKTIAEKLLSFPGLKMLQSGKVSGEVNEKEKNTKLVNSNSGKEPEQNISCSDDLASGNQEVSGNSIADVGSTHGIQDYVPSDENQLHSVNNIDLTLSLPNDQLTELLKEFPYGIDSSKALKKNEKKDSATKVNEIKEGQETQTCGQSSEANHVLDQIIITILNPQQMKELFPECNSQSSNKLENQENDKLSVASENTNKSHISTALDESINTTTETVQKPTSHSFCCVQAWLALKYSVDPCKHMLAKEAVFKQDLFQNLPSEIKEGSETNETSSNCQLNSQQQTIFPISNNPPSEVESNQMLTKTSACKECDLQEKECKLLKEDKGLAPCPFLVKLESMEYKNEEQDMDELQGKVRIHELCNQKCTTLVSKSQEQLYSGTDYSKTKSVSSSCKKEWFDKGRTPKEIVVDKSNSDTLQHRSMESRHNKKKEKYKIKRDSSETHIIKGPTFKRGLKKHIVRERKHKTEHRSCSTVTSSSNVSNVDLISKVYSNAQHSQECLNTQKGEIEIDLENNKVMRREQSESNSSEPSSQPVEHNKGNFARTNLKKFAYPEERGNVWKYRRTLSDNIKTSKVQALREQLRNMYKTHSSSKDASRGGYKRDKCFAKPLSDKKSSCNRKSNTLTLQREQKKNYLNKVAFKQTERSICLTKLEQSPSKSVWHVKSNSASEHPEDKKDSIPSSQQSEVVKPQMLEFKMCPEIVFKNLVSEDVSDAKKLPEREIIPVSAVKSRREDWLNYTPPKKRKTDEKETQVDDRIPLDTAVAFPDKNEGVKNSNIIFETYRKMHLKKSRSLDSSPIN